MSYITVNIDYKTRMLYNEQQQLVCWQWCVDNFGPPGQQPWGEFRWQWNTHRSFHFFNESDAALFALKWL